ncbi:glutamine--fructose-6-phosphate transaminase (isomerizing) [Rickettsiales bacterium LUAb2]
MCGIVGGISSKNIVDFIINGLDKLEYRGYDSVGLAFINNNQLYRSRVTERVKQLALDVKQLNVDGKIGIGHTRWATHGGVSIKNAHPHFSNEQIAVVHNGIIENYIDIKEDLISKGYIFESETDTEVIAHLIHYYYKQNHDLLNSVKLVVKQLKGAYAIAVMAKDNEHEIICARLGSPMVIGLTDNDMYFASDVSALLNVTKKFIYLEDHDIVSLKLGEYKIFDKTDQQVNRKVSISQLNSSSTDLGDYQYYMQKEIFEQEAVAKNILSILGNNFESNKFGDMAENIFKNINKIQIISCGTSYIAGTVAKYWLEELTGLDVSVDIASEYHYRAVSVNKNSLIISISQSGETADTLSSIKHAINLGMDNTLCICNVAESSLVRLSKLHMLIGAGPEIGVASTKAFTAQLIILLYLSYVIAKVKGKLGIEEEQQAIEQLHKLPNLIANVLTMSTEVENIAKEISNYQSSLFLGRNVFASIAEEGALKLKEISYIHAESYAAGELKHGPIALIDNNMPVIILLAKNLLADKVKSNIEEVLARKGKVYLFTDFDDEINNKCHKVIKYKFNDQSISNKLLPIIYNIPLQLLAYYTALHKKLDVDKPRNLAKSVTVE